MRLAVEIENHLRRELESEPTFEPNTGTQLMQKGEEQGFTAERKRRCVI